jgi:hypothetical protein
MGRATRQAKTNILAGVGVALVLGFSAWGVAFQTHQKTNIINTAPTDRTSVPTTYVSYLGLNGKTALELLKSHAKVQTKSSSLGDFVVAINGNDGGRKKYWLYFVNHKEADVGAATYITKNGDLVEWKLE